MKKSRYKLFSYLFIDHLAAQKELNNMARQGWALAGFLGPFARFRPTERTDLTYFLDWYDPMEEDDQDYLQLCEDAGWERKYQWKYCTIYASKPGLSPAPIQTDPEIEYQRFKKKVLRRKWLEGLSSLGGFLLHLLLLAVMILIVLSVNSHTDFTLSGLLIEVFTFSNALTLLIFCSPLLLAAWVSYYIFLWLRLHRWKQALERGENVPGNSGTVQIWKFLSFLRFLCLLFSLFLYWFDALFNHVGHWAYPTVSIFAGIMIALDAEKEERDKLHGGLLLSGLSAVALLCLLLNAPIRSVFPGRLPQVPIIVEHELSWENDRSDTVLGSSTEWVEKRTGEILTFRAKVFTWQTPSLSQQSLLEMTKDLVPLEGYSDIWIDPDTAFDYLTTYVLAQGNTQLRLICRSEEFPAFLPEILRWMEQVK